jgi:hypothetical protein
MAWLTPRTWTPGETVTAAMMNQHVRDNLNVLKTSIGDDGAIVIPARAARFLMTTTSGGFAVWGTEEFNDDPALYVRQTPNTEVKVTEAGVYVITWGHAVAGATVDTGYAGTLQENGSSLATTGTHSGNTGGNVSTDSTTIDRVAADDVLRLQSASSSRRLGFVRIGP